MPIKKFTSFEEASKDLWVLETNDDYYEKLKNLFELWYKLSEKKSVKGIQKFSDFQAFIKIKDNFSKKQ